MVFITEELVRKRSEHNECIISTLEELALHQEDIEKIEHIQNWCRNLKILLLQSNIISKIENLNKLKNLQYLNLTLNNIEVIENLEGCESLQKLDLTLNFIGKLTSVEKLQANYHLEQLFLSGNPCTDYEGYREYVIATLPQLLILDSVEIERSERIKALQAYDLIKPAIQSDQIAYEKKREYQKRVAAIKNCTESSTPKEDEKFWQEMSDNTPETRVELSKHARRSKQQTKEPDNNTANKRQIKLFNKDGKPNNINEAKIPFTFEEDDKRNCFVLTIKLYKHLDTSLVDVDIHPQYVTVKVKGNIFQMTLAESIQVDHSSVQRSQITGHLVITMPKVQGEIRKNNLQPVRDTYSTQQTNPHSGVSKRQYLEIGMENDLDFSKIVERGISKNYKQNESATRIKEKIPSPSFQDDQNVPPLI